MPGEPRTESGVWELVQTLMIEVGRDPEVVESIIPQHGCWRNALSYRVVGKTEATLFRSDIDDSPRSQEARDRLREALKAFPPKGS